MPDDIDVGTKGFIINQKIATWRNTYYDASLDAMIAGDIGDDILKNQAASRMKQCLKAIEQLEKLASELEPAQPVG
jgi:hypothetical protein